MRVRTMHKLRERALATRVMAMRSLATRVMMMRSLATLAR